MTIKIPELIFDKIFCLRWLFKGIENLQKYKSMNDFNLFYFVNFYMGKAK